MAKQTRGEYLVGASFNPSGSTIVDEIKMRTAALIDLLNVYAEDRSSPGAREASIAITNFEQAAMWGVKAVTKPEPNPDEGDPIGAELQEHADRTSSSD